MKLRRWLAHIDLEWISVALAGLIPLYIAYLQWTNLLPGRWWVLAGVVCIVGCYSFFVEPRWLKVEQVVLPLERLPAELDGLRIVHLSDLHLRRAPGPGSVQSRALAVAREFNADLVVITGDVMHYLARRAEGALALSELRARRGVFACLGNHEHDFTNFTRVWKSVREPVDPEEWRELYAQAGITLLVNEARPLPGSQAWIAGVDDLYSSEADLETTLGGIPQDAFCLLISHDPDIVDEPQVDRVDLVFAGHTHGGQCRLPLLGPVIAPCKHKRKRAAGLSRWNGVWLYVSRGLGSGAFPRLFCRPEVTLITLRRPSGSPGRA